MPSDERKHVGPDPGTPRKHDTGRGILLRIRIPRANVRNIKYHLAVAGVVETTVFPDLEGLARELTAQYAEPIKTRP